MHSKTQDLSSLVFTPLEQLNSMTSIIYLLNSQSLLSDGDLTLDDLLGLALLPDVFGLLVGPHLDVALT